MPPGPTDFESSDLESEVESVLSMIGGTWTDSEFAVDMIASGSLIMRFATESPVGSTLPSSDLMVCSGSKARAAVGAANPSKIKSPRISAT